MVFAQDGKVTLTKSASYDQLNKQVNKYSDEGLPKSAIATLDILLEKAEEDRNFAEYINALKLWAGYRMDVAPDSILPDLQRMENLFVNPMLTNASDVKSRQAILHALLVSVYGTVRNSSLTRRNEELNELCKNKAKEHTFAALENKEALAGVDAKPYERLYEHNEDSRLYNNDVLSLLLDFLANQGFSNIYIKDSKEEFLKQLEQTHQIYQQKRMRDAAMLVQMRIWDLQSNLASKKDRLSIDEKRKLLKKMYEENSDAETAADACMAYYNMTSFKSNQERLQFLRMAQQRFPNSPYASVFKSYEKSLFDKQVSVNVDGSVVAERPFEIVVVHKNVKEVNVMVETKKGKAVFQKTVVSEGFIQSDDYVEDLRRDTLSLSLQPGVYTVTARCEDMQEVSKEFRVSTLKLITYILPGESRTVCVVEALSGKPVPGCKVFLGETRYEKGKTMEVVSDTTYTTDKNGIAMVSQYKQWDWAYAEKSKDDISNHVSLDRMYNRDYDEEDDIHYTIFTDRSIYRPGQTVYVTGYVYSQLGDDVSRERTSIGFHAQRP